jgi:predicted transcriptional regulator
MKKLTAKDVMQQEILSVKTDWYIDRLANFLIENFISGAPVISDSGKLIGVVSLTDIVRNESFPVQDPKSATPHGYYINELDYDYSQEDVSSFRIENDQMITVQDIMTLMIFDVDESVSVQQVADYMIKGHIHRVFVTREKKLTGIITALDLLKVIRDM